MLLSNINRKACMGSPLVLLHLTLVTLKGQSRSLRFRKVISAKGAELGHVLLLNTNSKSHMGSPKAPSNLTLRG